MSAVTFTKTFAVKTPAAAVPAKGFFARVFESIVAARSAQAEREVARYMATRVYNPDH